MADSRVNRKVTYRLYPTRAQEERLLWMLDRHRWLYNAALEHRITAWRRAGESVSYAQQCKELTAIRAEDEDYAGINAQSLQVTLKRLDLAFQHFFRRVRQGQTPGFPRFKGKHRFHSFGYKSHGDGWKLFLPEKTEAEKHRPRTGRIRISGVGLVRMRGRDRNDGVPKTCEIRRRNGRWYASVTFACTPVRERGTEEDGLDWGTKAFATVVTGSGETLTIDNPRHLAEAEERLTRAQQILSRKTKGSKSWRKAKLRFARLHERVQNRRDDFLHKTSAALISRFARIATEELAVAP